MMCYSVLVALRLVEVVLQLLPYIYICIYMKGLFLC